MKKQILVMACATFLLLPPAIGMENIVKETSESVVHAVFSTPEISVKILGYASYRRPHYICEFNPLGDDFGRIRPMTLYEVVNSLVGLKFSKLPRFYREHRHCLELNIIFKMRSYEELQLFLDILDSEDPSIHDLEGLKMLQLVSSDFCQFGRFHITSIISPSWANDNDLQTYSATLPCLKRLTIKEIVINQPPNSKGVVIGNYVNSQITDDGLNKLTMLTELRLETKVGITDNGLKTLTNLTHLDLEENWDITHYGLINELDKPWFPKLKLLLLPNEHPKITEETMGMLEDHGVTIKESEYSIPAIDIGDI